MKLWICGICQNNVKEIEEIFSPIRLLINPLGEKDNCNYNVNGIWVDGGSTDGTQEKIKSFGLQVIERKWTNDHDFQMNEYLRCGLIKHGDWVIQMDTSERIHWWFVEKLEDEMLANFEAQNINTVYQRSKPILFKYHDNQIFSGSPHWGVVGQRPNIVDISKFDGFQDDKQYFWSLRDDINKWITNGIKYYYVYGRSNHMWLVYSPDNHKGGSSPNLIAEHEANRLAFREYCRTTLGLLLDGSTDAIMAVFDGYIKNHKLTPEFIQFMNNEKVIANYYRYLQGEDQQTIYNTQNTWKFSIL